MSWSGIASNQTVSFDNLQDAVTTGVFRLKNTIPVPSLEQITKADADFYVYIDTAFGPYAAKASNQLVVKSNLQLPYFCYEINTITTELGECFDCPNTYASVSDTEILFRNECSGTQIPPPAQVTVISYYSDSSTETTIIPAGTTGTIFIASSNVQCGSPPGCTPISTPTFSYAEVNVSFGAVPQCCEVPPDNCFKC